MRCPFLSQRNHCMFDSRKNRGDCPLLQLDESQWDGECKNLSGGKYKMMMRYN